MSRVKIDLFGDWIETVREIFRGSGFPFEPGTPDAVVGQTYYRQSADTDEEARRLSEENESRLRSMQATILEHLDGVIVPDIRARTGYEGDDFEFKWVYQQGEHIVETFSKYRIPLG